MTTSAEHETTVEADSALPTGTMVREFDAAPDRVFRAFVERDLVARWLGPDDAAIHIDTWDARTGGSYRYVVRQDGVEVAAFYGSFHEVRPSTRLVQTQTFDDLGDGQTRMTSVTLMESFEDRDGLIASGMEEGVVAGYAKLDEMLVDGVG